MEPGRKRKKGMRLLFRRADDVSGKAALVWNARGCAVYSADVVRDYDYGFCLICSIWGLFLIFYVSLPDSIYCYEYCDYDHELI